MVAKAKRGRPPAHPDRRHSILAAALECFVDRGFYGTAMPQIAEKAGVAAGTIYHYFPSKEALVNELYRSWKSEVSRRVFMAFPQGAEAREQFRMMFHEMLRFAKEEPTAFAFIELHNHKSYLDDESLAVDRKIKDFTRMMIELAQAQGEVKPVDPSALMELIFGAFVGLMQAGYEKRIELSDETTAQLEAACWDTVALHGSDGTKR